MKRLMTLLMLAMFSTGLLAGHGVAAGEKIEDKAQDCKDAHC